jgi:hypothetical protein
MVEVTLDTIIIFLAFVIVVFLVYKTFKMIVKATLIVVAAFTFPWIAQYMGLPIMASLETGVMFAFAGFGLFLVYEFFNFIIQFFRILLWPFRRKREVIPHGA